MEKFGEKIGWKNSFCLTLRSIFRFSLVTLSLKQFLSLEIEKNSRGIRPARNFRNMAPQDSYDLHGALGFLFHVFRKGKIQTRKGESCCYHRGGMPGRSVYKLIRITREFPQKGVQMKDVFPNHEESGQVFGDKLWAYILLGKKTKNFCQNAPIFTFRKRVL